MTFHLVSWVADARLISGRYAIRCRCRREKILFNSRNKVNNCNLFNFVFYLMILSKVGWFEFCFIIEAMNRYSIIVSSRNTFATRVLFAKLLAHWRCSFLRSSQIQNLNPLDTIVH